MSAKIRAMIVDDEQLAIDLVADFLQDFASIEVIAACNSSRDALQQITALKPDLLFLDIKMPVMNGFELIAALGDQHRPWIIFTTAYDAFAVKAFEVHAIGYLLKPFDREKFGATVRRFLSDYNSRNSTALYEQINQLLVQQNNAAQYLQRILIKEKQKAFYIPVQEIISFEAAGDYVKLMATSKSYLVNDSLTALEQKLDPDVFIRVHRSAIVNALQVKEFIPYSNGEYSIVMKNNDIVKTSRNYSDQLARVFPEL